MINRLLQFEVDYVYIQDNRTDDIEVFDVLSDKTRETALKTIKQTFQEMFSNRAKHKPLIKQEFYGLFKPILEDMLKDIKSSKQAMLMLSAIYVKDLYLYTHSLQVSIFSIAMGINRGYTHQQLIELGLGALLHDVGKTNVPIEILEKKGSLTKEEYEEVKKHSIHGFDMLRSEYGIPLLSAHCAFQHHERLNGGGYPRGLKGEEIHEYARIVGIADVYDALRVYKDPSLPHEALEYLYTRAELDFERTLLDNFKKTVALYPLGINVKLSSGESGVVVDVNANLPDRPVVRILEDENNLSISEPYEVDLSKELSKVIVAFSG